MPQAIISTGIPGLDHILMGGLPRRVASRQCEANENVDGPKG